MIDSLQNLETNLIPLPITQQAIEIARFFAEQQLEVAKKEQVYLNTIAVVVMDNYLQMMGISTELTASESWNPVVRLGADVADIKVTGCGHLECRPVKPGVPKCYIPPEVKIDRCGYVVIEIDEEQQQAALLGFTKIAVGNELAITQLQSIDSLLEYIEQLIAQKVNLSNWFQNIFEVGWQSMTALLGTETAQLVPSLRSGSSLKDTTGMSVKGVKLIDLGIQLQNQAVALLVTLTAITDEKVKVRVQVHPVATAAYLPSNLQLAVLSEMGEILREVRSRSLDNYIQLPHFTGKTGESFSIRLALNETSITEDFIL